LLLNEPSTKSSAYRSFTKDRSTPDFIAFGTDTVDFGIQKAEAANDPPSMLTWQIRVTDIDSAIERCHSAGSQL
jgi:predicted enzyme related to lactoylglutathione lyase